MPVRDLIEVLLSYASGDDKTTINIKELSSLIPGLETMSPRTRCEEIVQVLISELDKKNLKPISVFRMADIKNAGGVQANVIEVTFKKVLPQIKEEVIKEAMKSFNVGSGRDIITRQDFETIFSEQ